jgi:hypothetical protein
MGLFDKKQDSKIVYLESIVEDRNKEVEYLRKQVSTLQEALVSKEAPLGYQSMKADESWLKDSAKERKLEHNVMIQLMQEREKPLFGEVDELLSALGGILGPPKSAPIGDGSEG